jgi:ribose transport system permease protein
MTTTEAMQPPAPEARGRAPRPLRLRRVLAGSEAGVVISLALLVLLFQVLNAAFLSGPNVRAMLGAMSFVGIVAVGQTLLLVAGEFDLSVGSVAGLSAVVAAWLMSKGHLPAGVGLAGGLACGAGLGLVNGLVVVRLGIPAFIATLGMLYVAQGLAQLITHGYPIYPLPGVVGEIGQAKPLLGIGWSFVVLVLLVVAADVLLRRTTVGRNLYATGGNKEIARLVGIDAGRYKIACFVLTGALAALAGMFVMGELASGSTSIGSGWELTVIAGVVVGGVSLFGGVGTVVAGFVGMLLLQVVQSGLVVAGVSASWQPVAVGVIMVVAVALDLFRRRLSAEGGLRRRARVTRATAEDGGAM